MELSTSTPPGEDTPDLSSTLLPGDADEAHDAGTVSQVGRDGEVTNPPHGNFVYIDHGGAG